ncbi:MAG: hypothetical protein ABIQ95_03040 [Bdellovibrionia bacterium]
MKVYLTLVSSLTLLFGLQAFAYIPPSQFIVKSWVNKHSGMKALKLRSMVTEYTSDKPTPVHFKTVSVYNAEAQKLKSWAINDFDKVLYSTERDLTSLSPLSKLLFLSDLKEVIKTLKSSGVPVQTEAELLKFKTELERRESEQESLIRWNGTVVWALGAADSKQEPESAQLWFEKDLFLPLRFLFRTEGVGDLYDVRLENYRFTREFPYPRGISLRKKGAGIMFSEQIVDISLNSDAQASKRPLGSGFTELGQNSPSELRNLIQNYYDIIR